MGKYSKFNTALLAYKEQIEEQLMKDCQKVIDMINARVLNTDCTEEAKAFFVKMVGDYYRYIAENAKDQKLEDVKDHAKACELADNALQQALDKIDELEEDDFR